MTNKDKKDLIVSFLHWVNNVSATDPMRLETDNDDIAEMFLEQTNPKEHFIKTWPEYFEKQLIGDKLFEVRKDDRSYQVGDIFVSEEYDVRKNEYTGRGKRFTITYVLRDVEMFGLKAGLCILQLKPIE